MTEALERKLKNLPRKPGVYFHKSKDGEIIYVGKAASLKNRVRQYFQESRLRDDKTTALVNDIYDTDWIEVDSEVDALFLESEMIKRYMPRYNILLRDDKSQTYVRINMKDEWPVVSFTRNPIDDGAEYIGPFYNGLSLKRAVRFLRKAFPYLVKERKPGQSRLDEDLGLSPKESDGSAVYKANLRKLIQYIKGNRKSITKDLERDMMTAAGLHDFEKAAKIRNRLRVMQELQNRVMFGDKEFLDISKDRALSDLAWIFGSEKIYSRIEGFDISHMGGKDVVASMVVFNNGASDRAEYRKFKVKEKNDDTGNMYEVVLRRLSEKNVKSWGVPDLIIIDGGKGQVGAAIQARDERGISKNIPIIGIAKREEEIIIHAEKSGVLLHNLQNMKNNPLQGVFVDFKDGWVIVNLHAGQNNASGHSKNLRGGSLSPYDDIVKLFQRIRDESHRFAVSYHTVLKRSKTTKSVLDDISGVGNITKKKLLSKFGSVSGVKRASIQELRDVVGESLALKIKSEIGEENDN